MLVGSGKLKHADMRKEICVLNGFIITYKMAVRPVLIVEEVFRHVLTPMK